MDGRAAGPLGGFGEGLGDGVSSDVAGDVWVLEPLENLVEMSPGGGLEISRPITMSAAPQDEKCLFSQVSMICTEQNPF